MSPRHWLPVNSAPKHWAWLYLLPLLASQRNNTVEPCSQISPSSVHSCPALLSLACRLSPEWLRQPPNQCLPIGASVSAVHTPNSSSRLTITLAHTHGPFLSLLAKPGAKAASSSDRCRHCCHLRAGRPPPRRARECARLVPQASAGHSPVAVAHR